MTNSRWRVKGRSKSASWILSLLIGGVGWGADARADNEVFDARGFNANRDYFSQLPYEHIDPLTGNLLLTFTDLVLPGNAGFDLRIQRTYNSKIFKDYHSSGDTLDEDSWAGIGWTLHLGRVLHATSGVPASVEMPDGSRRKLYHHISPNSPPCVPPSGCYITRDFWVYTETNPPLLLLPDGTKYTLARAISLSIGGVSISVRYPTRIEDPFGNFVTIAYMSTPADGIQTITQDLGAAQVRTITFTATGTRNTLSSMSYTGSTTHTWTYTQLDANAPGFSLLTRVAPPVGPSWQYQYNTSGAAVSPCTVSSVRNELIGITTPNGGQIDYIYCDKTFHLGSTVPVRTRSAIRRSTRGRGITAGTWIYDYAPDLGGSENQSRITAPSACGTITTTYTFMGVGNYSSQGSVWKIGLLQSRVRADGGATLETENLTWTPSALISNDIETVGFNQDVGISVALVGTRTLTRGGQNYVTTNTYSTNASNFNDYGRPYQIDENGDLTGTRRTTRTFQYGFTPYLVDRIASETVSVGSESFAKSYGYNSANGFKNSQTIYGITTSYTPTTTRGNVASSTNNNNTTTYSYSWGLADAITTPMYPITRGINPEGTIASETRQYWNGSSNLSTTTSFQYDAAFRLTRRTPPVGNFTATSYDNTGGAWMQVTRGSSRTTTNLDGLGRPTGTSNSVDIQTRIDHDACGRKSYESYPQSGPPDATHGTSYQYDGLDRITRKTNNADNPDTFVRYAYGPGLQVAVTDENSHVTTQVWKAFGNPADARLTSLTEPNSRQTSYTYNALGSLTRVTHPTTLARTWTYFATTGLLQQESHPESGTASYTYDPAGNVQTRTDFRGQTTYGYDGNNRLTSITRPTGFTDYNTTFQYDGSDQRKLAQNGYVTSNFAYDAANRVVSRTDMVNGRSFVTAYSVYDANDNLQQLDYPSGTQVTYAYDSENRITTVGKPGTPSYFASGFTYHPSGAVASFQPAGSNALQQFAYDDRYRLQNLRTGARDLTYGYDPVGNVLAVSDTRPNMNRGFTYDALDRLGTGSGYWGSGSMGYDDLGNRTSTSVGGSVSFNYSSSTNRLTSYTGSGTLGYDAGGNTTADGVGGTYAYTADSLIRTATVGGATTSYYYDGDNLRTRKLDPSGVNHYYLHGPGNQILSEFGDPCAGQTAVSVRDYVYAAGRLLAAVRPSTGATMVALTASASSVGEAAGPALVGVRVTTSGGGPTVCPVSVAYATADGTAAAGADYTAVSGTLTFPAGTASGSTQTINVPIVNDSVYEPAESFSITLSGATGAVLTTPINHTVTISNDDSPPTLSIGDASVTEGNSGTTSAVFTVTLSGATAVAATVTYATADGTAIAGSDYTAASETLTFAPGVTTQQVVVQVAGETVIEPAETFLVNLSSPQAATLARSQAVGTITNDDFPTVSVDDQITFEGEQVLFHMRLSQASFETVTVDYATQDCSATAGTDFQTTSGSLDFSPGEIDRTFTVPTLARTGYQGARIFVVRVFNLVRANAGDTWGQGTIRDLDPQNLPAPRSDFNGDNHSDIVWLHQSTGEPALWFMKYTTQTSGASLAPSSDTAWKIVGTADFNADGKPDLLWRKSDGQNYVWLMDGTVILAGVSLPSSETNWSVVGTGDFNSDGKPDILWQDYSTGESGTWFMDGTTLTGGASLPAIGDTNWRIVGVADFTGDSKPDLLWRHQVTGENYIWIMDGTTLVGGATQPTETDLRWKIMGTGDFTRDGKTDVLWEHEVSGSVVVWQYDGTTRTCVSYVSPQDHVDPAWKIVGPR